VVYTETVYNLTGATDSFDLALSGSVWMATLSTSGTGPMDDMTSVDVTVEVEVPPGADPGDSDSVSLIATSANHPGVHSDTATLTTTALSGQYGYVLKPEENEIDVVDTVLHVDTGITINTTPYGNHPDPGELSPDGQWLYVSLEYSGAVLVIDTATHTPATALAVGEGPDEIAFSGDGSRAFVVNRDDYFVSVIDTSVPTVTTTIPVPRWSWSVASSPCLDKVYVSHNQDDSVSVIDIETLTVTHVIAGFDNPADIVVSPYGHRAYVIDKYDGRRISVIDTMTDELIDHWTVPGSYRLDISPDGTTLYLADEHVVHAVDTGTGEIVATISPDAESLQDVEVFPASAGPTAYASAPDDGEVVVLDTASNSQVGTIALGGEPDGLALFPMETACLSGTVLLEPTLAYAYGGAGETVVFTETVANLTGATDSFDLALAGDVWTATLSIANTGPIPTMASLSFTVEVEIPAGAVAGDYDELTVTATSVNSDGLYTSTAELTAAVPRPGYIFSRKGDVIDVVDTQFHRHTGITIDTSAYGDDPWRGALSPDGAWLYTSFRYSDAVLVVDTATRAPVTSLDVGRAHGIAFSADSSYAFAANREDGTVTVIDTGVPAVTTTIPVGDYPKSIAGSPCLDKVYVTNRDDSSVSVIDVGTLTVTAVITGFDHPWDVVVSPSGGQAYVSNKGESGGRLRLPSQPNVDGSIGVIDTATDSLVATWIITGSAGLGGLDISPDGRTLYAVDSLRGIIYAIDTATGEVLDEIIVGPLDDQEVGWEIEVFPAGAGPYAYATIPNYDLMRVIDTDSNTVVRTILLTDGPRGLALFPPSTLCGASPYAAFIPETSAIVSGETVTFTNLSTGSPPLSTTWDFGDGSPTSSEIHPSHTYNMIGTFSVVLTATNPYGEDIATGTVTVEEEQLPIYLPLVMRRYP
jgi:YVTN family beta-propeller protein